MTRSSSSIWCWVPSSAIRRNRIWCSFYERCSRTYCQQRAAGYEGGMKRRIAGYLGITRPFRFERTLTVLFALILASVAGAAAVRFELSGSLTAGTPRSWYFVYVAALIGLAVICAPWPRMAAVALSVAALELGLGLGSAVLHRQGLTENDLLP